MVLWLHISASASSRTLVAFLITKQTHSGSAPIRSICPPWKSWRSGSFNMLAVQHGQPSRFTSRSKNAKRKSKCYIEWLCVIYSTKKNKKHIGQMRMVCCASGWAGTPLWSRLQVIGLSLLYLSPLQWGWRGSLQCLHAFTQHPLDCRVASWPIVCS